MDTQQLTELKVSELMKKAAADGVPVDALAEAQDEDSPKAALIALIKAKAGAQGKRPNTPNKPKKHHPALLEMVQAAQIAVKHAGGSTDPAKVGAAFKRTHGKTFDEARVSHNLSAKTKLNHYIIGPEPEPEPEPVPVKKKKQQKKKAPAPEVHRCDVCDIAFSGDKQLNEHLAGKKHKNRLQPEQSAKKCSRNCFKISSRTQQARSSAASDAQTKSSALPCLM